MTTILIEKNIKVTMRDGMKLATDVYRLEGASPTPVLVVRTPYNKDHMVAGGDIFDILRAVQVGYTVVTRDVRGRYASEGSFNPHVQETADGLDAFAWAAAQPWSNGVVGTFGGSYLGATQWLPAVNSRQPCGRWRHRSPSQMRTRAAHTREEQRCSMISAGWLQTSFRPRSSAVSPAGRNR